jgi:uncharacterized heparinase superfamily protein
MGAALQGPSSVEAKRSNDGSWLSVAAQHDGYAASYGVVHHRMLALARDGASLYGEDRLTADGKTASQAGTPVAVRFHLHPDIKADIDNDDAAATLVTPSHQAWRFEANGRPIAIEESVFFAAPGRPRRSSQLVVHSTIADAEPIVWSLTRM